MNLQQNPAHKNKYESKQDWGVLLHKEIVEKKTVLHVDECEISR